MRLLEEHPSSHERIAWIHSALTALSRAGVKSVTLQLDGDWFNHFLVALNVRQISVGTYSDDVPARRFFQTSGANPPEWLGMRVMFNTDEVGDDCPPGAVSAFVAHAWCGHCGDLMTFFSGSEELARAAASMYGELVQ